MAQQIPPANVAPQLGYLLNQAQALIDGFDPVVSKYEVKSSEYLFGVIGTLVFVLGSIILRPQITRTLGLEFVPVIGTISTLLGLVLGLSLFRGPSRWRMERNLRKLGLQLDAFRTEVKNLDAVGPTPVNIKRQLWSAYDETIDAYRQIELFSYRASNYPFVFLSNKKK